jgi:putative transposase
VGQRGRQWDVRRLGRKTGQVWVPKAGWVRFRWSRPVPEGAKSYRVTQDRAGRWHVAFAVIPAPVPAPGNGQVVGIDRGVAVSAALSTGQLLPRPDRPGADQAAATAAQAGPREAWLEPPRAGRARDRPAAGPGEGPA